MKSFGYVCWCSQKIKLLTFVSCHSQKYTKFYLCSHSVLKQLAFGKLWESFGHTPSIMLIATNVITVTTGLTHCGQYRKSHWFYSHYDYRRKKRIGEMSCVVILVIHGALYVSVVESLADVLNFPLNSSSWRILGTSCNRYFECGISPDGFGLPGDWSSKSS